MHMQSHIDQEFIGDIRKTTFKLPERNAFDGLLWDKQNMKARISLSQGTNFIDLAQTVTATMDLRQVLEVTGL